MDWINAEHFQDVTAGEAMCLAMITDPRRTEALDDEGCRKLAEAVVIQAVLDLRGLLSGRPPHYYPDADLKELEAFFLSDWCRLFGYSGRRILCLLREEVKGE